MPGRCPRLTNSTMLRPEVEDMLVDDVLGRSCLRSLGTGVLVSWGTLMYVGTSGSLGGTGDFRGVGTGSPEVLRGTGLGRDGFAATSGFGLTVGGAGLTVGGAGLTVGGAGFVVSEFSFEFDERGSGLG